MAEPDRLELRRYDSRDEPGVVDLLQQSLDIPPELALGLFRWKHDENPFGQSLAWLALDGTLVVAFRPFLRWQFERGGNVVPAVRAVDTATHQNYRGRGLFRRLTEVAVDDMHDNGVAFVFNTPNSQSMPGYLKMGWQVVGRLPALARARSVSSLRRVARARASAQLDPVPCSVGLPAIEALRDSETFGRLLKGQPGGGAVLRTHKTVDYLAWRFGFEPLGYRVLPSKDGIEGGVAFFRLRKRGAALEAAVCEVLAPAGDRRAEAALIRGVARQSGADYCVRLMTDGLPRAGFVPVPRQGPILTWRALATDVAPDLHDWRLALGDIELF